MNIPDGVNIKTTLIITILFLFVSTTLLMTFFQEETKRLTGKVVYGEDGANISDDVLQRLQKDGEVAVIARIKQPKNPLWTTSNDISAKQASQDHIQDDLEPFPRSQKVSLTLTEENLQDAKSNPYFSQLYLDVKVKSFLPDSKDVINATEAWNYNGNMTGQHQTICVIDGGIDYTHPGLGNCTTTQFLNGSCPKVLDGYDYYNDNNDSIDINGHGTHVAGIVAGEQPVNGIAPNATLVSLKSLEDGSGTFSDSTKAIEWCTNHKKQYNISVITMSLGTTETYSTYCDDENLAFNDMSTAMEEAQDKNITVTVATGNENNKSAISSPACLEPAGRVTATDNNDNYPDFANRASYFNDTLTAPGTTIESMDLGSGTTTKTGTSMSTPHVAGAAALTSQYFQKINRTANHTTLLTNLRKYGKNAYDAESDQNYTRINLYNTIDEQQNDTPPTPTITITYTTQNQTLGNNQTITWTITNATYVNLTITNTTQNTIYQDNTTNGTTTLNTTTLNTTGTYNTTITANNSQQQTTTTEPFRIKQYTTYNYTINNQTNHTTLDQTNTIRINQTQGPTTYTLTYQNTTKNITQPYYKNTTTQPTGTTNYTLTSPQTTTYYKNTTTIQVKRLNKTITITNYTPTNTTLTIPENETTTLNVTLNNPLENYSTTTQQQANYTKNQTLLTTNTTYTTNTNLAITNHTYHFHATNNKTQTTQNWTITTTPTPPTIRNTTPSTPTTTIYKNNTQLFNHTTTDPLNRTIHQSWTWTTLQQQTQNLTNYTPTTNQTYHYNTTNTTPGTYTLTLTTTINKTGVPNTTATWNVTIKDTLQPINHTQTIPDQTFNEDEEQTINLTTYFTWDDQDNTTITTTADKLTTETTTSKITLKGDPAEEDINITVTGKNDSATSNTFTVTIEENTDETDTSSGSSGGGGGGGSLGTTSTTETTNTTNTTNTTEPTTTNDDPSNPDTTPDTKPIKPTPTYTSQQPNATTHHTITTNTTIQTITAITTKPNTTLAITINETNTTKNPHPQPTYTYLNITPQTTITANITFTTPKTWHNKTNTTANQTTLNRYDKTWKEQPTTHITQNQTHHTYQSHIPNFSLFSITKQKKQRQQTPQPQQTTYTTPLLSILIVLLIATTTYSTYQLRK